MSSALIDEWRAIAADADTGWDSISGPPYEAAFGRCADGLEAACTPRQLQAEWFGTGEKQWDSWWFESVGVLHYCRQDDLDPRRIKGVDETKELAACYLSGRYAVASCVPVAREGFPAPAGWSVVGL